ncbi:MAG: lipocalin family protein [Bacteroidota bacterium]
MKKSTIMYFVSFVVLASACSIVELDEEPNETQLDGGTPSEVDLGGENTPEEEIVFAQMLHGADSKTWIASEFSIEGMSGFLDCRLDDVITLYADGTYEYDGGNNLCGLEDNQRIRRGNWSYNFETTEVTLEPGTNLESTARVISLEGNILTLTGVYKNDILGSFDVSGRYVSN